jgi:peptidoglycan/xylan/chitin deacetylase (PgdA/CDA1 family)
MAACIGAAAPASARPVPILMYHHVAERPPSSLRHPRLWVPPARFARQMDALETAGYRPVTLGRVWRSWHGRGALPSKPIVVSFDDGYADQVRNAAPVLAARGWPGVLNLVADRLDVNGGIRRQDVLRLLAAGWEIGDHSLTHPDLTRVGRARMTREVRGSRRRLEGALGVAVRFFCYPYGRVDRRVRAAVRAAGFLAATTTRFGAAAPSDDRFALRRIQVTDESPATLLRSIERARRLTRSRG